tara:strand:- start:358 stop:951 length:594 start_codon:yes stop_codon:yes gene_type:complete
MLSKPTLKTKLLSIFGTLFFVIGLGLGSYLVSFEKHHITDTDFSVSQSLAFGNKPVMITFYTLSYICLILLVLLRGGSKKLLIIKVFLLILSYSLLITIIWITTFRDKTAHISFAGIIFISNLIFQMVSLYSFYNYVRNKKTIIATGLLQIIIVILIGVFLLLRLYSNLSIYDQLFSSFENLTVVSMSVVIFALGFI